VDSLRAFYQHTFQKYKVIARSSLELFYHGTSSTFLKKILKVGLQPQTKQGVWKEEDPDASPTTPSRKSYGGVYFSNNVMTSISYSNSTSRKFGGNPIVVMARLQLQTAVPDEDDFTGIITRCLDGLYGPEYRVSRSRTVLAGVLLSLYKGDAEGKKIQDTFVKNFREELGGNNPDSLAPKIMSAKFVKALHELLLASVIRILSHEYWKEDYDRLINEHLPKGEDIPEELRKQTAAEGERLYRDALNTVLNHARRYVKHTHWNKTLRILSPVGFSGRNRIECIVEVIQKEDTYLLKIIYGQKIPEVWLNEFKKLISPRVEIIR
jgi:hypothetical protein